MTAERGQREADSSLASGVGDMRLKSVLGNPTEGDSGAMQRPVGDGSLTERQIKAAAKALGRHDSGLWSRGGTSEAVLFSAIHAAIVGAK